MTEPGRIDLRALDELADPARAERVISAALARVNLTPRALPWLAGRFRPILAVAAVLFLVAFGLLRGAPRAEAPVEPSAALAGWVASDHVPSNGEILTAFRGYRP